VKKTIGIIGPGKHFTEKIYPIIKKNKKLKILAILRKNKKKFKKIQILNEHNFFKKKFDFIYIATPNFFHEKFIIKSLNNNSHVICEKPFLLNDKKLQYILDLSKIKKKLIFEAFMYVYHPAFYFIKKQIVQKKYGKLSYIISNFKFPGLDKKNNRYNYNNGGFLFDSASYLISLESYLFNSTFDKKIKFFSSYIKKKISLRGNIIVISKKIKRFYFWGEGQNYSNNLEIFFENATIFCNKFFSKFSNEVTQIKIFTKNKIEKKNFKNINHFGKMFNFIFKNYKKKKFQNFCRKRIENQTKLMQKIRKNL